MSKDKSYCYHCGDDCGSAPVEFDQKEFCCNGCKSVYEILNANQLNKYYDYEDKPGVKPSYVSSEKYKFLESEEIADKLYQFKEGDTRRVQLFLPEIHCSSCIWLLENLHLLNDGVISAEVNFVKKEASINFNVEKISFKELASLLDKIGYPPKFGGGKKENARKIPRKFYLKLGVALFCFGNIMLFSFPEYSYTDASYLEFRPFFTYIILAMSVPMLLFSASDYWISAYKAIRAKTLNLDVPITIGIAALYGRSLYDILTNNGPGYMDSFAGFILFLLIGKWFQNYTYQALSFERDYKSYFPLAVTRMVDGKEEILSIEKIQEGDVLLIKNEEIIPADAELVKGKANIDYSFVTGESKAISKKVGDQIYAGGKQEGDAIELRVNKKVEQSYLTQLWNQKTFQKESSDTLTDFTEKLSRVFILGVLIVATITGLVWYFIDPSNVANIVTAVLIVACPCALALSIPFTFGNAMRTAGRNKLYLKNTQAVEQMGKVTDIVFDKTGTITTGHSSEVRFVGEQLDESQYLLVISLARNSAHPLSRAVYQSLYKESITPLDVESFEETPGAGTVAIIDGARVKMGSNVWVGATKEDTLETRVYLSLNDQVKGYFVIENKYRPEFTEIIQELRDNYNLHVLSGDNESERENLLSYFPDEGQLHFNQKPIDKLTYIQKLKDQGKVVMMMGDGLNDAGALKESNIGIVVADDVYNFSPACDGILDARYLNKLPQFLKLGQYSIKTLRISYIFSLMYNTVGLSFAVFNFLTPLVAAILMPISSVSVVALTTILIRKFESDRF